MDNTNANIDLIRSHVDIIILKPLESQDRYGYEILREIETNSNGLFNLKQPTMYSCLKRLEKQGYIRSYLGDESNGAQRRYYALTGQGRDFLESQQSQWEFVRTILSGLVSSEDFDKDKDVKPFDPSKYRPLTKRTRSEDDDDNEKIKIVEKIVYVPIDKSNENSLSSDNTNIEDTSDNTEVEKYIESIANSENDNNDNIDALTEYLNENDTENILSDNSAIISSDECGVKIEEDMSVSQDSLSYSNCDNSVIEKSFVPISQNLSNEFNVSDDYNNTSSEDTFDPEYIDESYDLMQNGEVIEDNVEFIEEFNAESTEDIFDGIESIEESVDDNYKEEFSEAYYEEELTAIATESFDTNESTPVDVVDALSDNSIVENGSISDENVENFESIADSTDNDDYLDASENYDVNDSDDLHVADTASDNYASYSTTSKREEWLEHYNYQNIKYSTYLEDDEDKGVSENLRDDATYNNVTYTTSTDVKVDPDKNDYEREINLFSVLDNIYTKKDNSENGDYDEESIKPRSADYSSTADSESSRPMVTINDLKIKLKNEGFNVKPYTKINSSEYYINNYYYCNRTGRDASLIMYVLLFFESMIAHFALAKNYNLPFWYLPIVWVSLAVIPAIATVIWFIAPYHKKRTRVSLRLSLLIGLIALLNIALVILLIGFFGFGADYRDVTTMMLPIIVPLIFLLNIPLYSLIYYLLYKTKRYNLR